MKAQIVEQVELFTEAELESLEFVPEELEAIEQERVPNLESISFEDIAEDLEAIFSAFEDIAEALEASLPSSRRSNVITRISDIGRYMELQTKIVRLTNEINSMSRLNPRRVKLIAERTWVALQLKNIERRSR